MTVDKPGNSPYMLTVIVAVLAIALAIYNLLSLPDPPETFPEPPDWRETAKPIVRSHWVIAEDGTVYVFFTESRP